MPARLFLAIAGAAGVIVVGADAAASHLAAGDAHRLELAAIASRYGLAHAAALLALALAGQRRADGWLAAAGWCFAAGLVLFCGGLDLLAAGAPQNFALAVPAGGIAFMLGWLAILIAALRAKPV